MVGPRLNTSQPGSQTVSLEGTSQDAVPRCPGWGLTRAGSGCREALPWDKHTWFQPENCLPGPPLRASFLIFTMGIVELQAGLPGLALKNFLPLRSQEPQKS